jgi:hypothetical protein
MWRTIQICPCRIILSTVFCVCGLGASAAWGGVVQSSAPFHLVGEYHPTPLAPSSFFDVFTNLYPPEPVFPPGPVVPPNPCLLDLSDPTFPALTLNVDNHALFDFGMIGPGGAHVTFDNPAVVLNSDKQLPTPGHLLLQTQAHFGSNRFFDVFFDTFYTYPPGPVAPVSFNPSNSLAFPPGPFFPSGTLSIDFAAFADFAAAGDPPFTVGIYVTDPASGNRATFSNASVPEPGTFTLWAAGMAILAGWRCRRPICRRSAGN